MTLTDEDIKRAQTILRRYRTNAIGKKNKKEQDNVEHIMRVLNALYQGEK
jgi:hypothetical protein